MIILIPHTFCSIPWYTYVKNESDFFSESNFTEILQYRYICVLYVMDQWTAAVVRLSQCEKHSFTKATIPLANKGNVDSWLSDIALHMWYVYTFYIIK